MVSFKMRLYIPPWLVTEEYVALIKPMLHGVNTPFNVKA